MLRGKYSFREYSERSEAGDEALLSVSEYFGVKPRRDNIDSDEHLSRAESLVGYKKSAVNDLVMNIMLAWKKGLGVSKYEGIVSPAYSVFRFMKHACPDYMHYLLRTDLYADYFKARSTGIMDSRLRLYPNVFGDLALLQPSLEEQTQIAKFLDFETAKIDALIEKQQQLIALLKEKRQAVIRHAVTKGLNPDAPIRDSGVEWLGEVPAHWEVKRLKHLFAEPLRNGVSPQAVETGGVLTFSIAAVRNGVVDIESHMKHADISIHAARPYWVHAGDVMMMRGNGSRDLVGSVGIVRSLPPDECIYPDILIRLRFSKEIDSRLAVLFLNSTVSRPQVAMGAKTAAGIWKVSGATVAEFTMPVPPSIEQDAIRDHLNLALTQIDALVARVESQGILLQERRTTLISAAVTGKIDVRGWKVPDSETEAEVA